LPVDLEPLRRTWEEVRGLSPRGRWALASLVLFSSLVSYHAHDLIQNILRGEMLPARPELIKRLAAKKGTERCSWAEWSIAEIGTYHLCVGDPIGTPSILPNLEVDGRRRSVRFVLTLMAVHANGITLEVLRCRTTSGILVGCSPTERLELREGEEASLLPGPSHPRLRVAEVKYDRKEADVVLF